MPDDFSAHEPGEAGEEAQITPFSTTNRGKPSNSVDNSTDPVKSALEGAQRISRGSSRPGRGRRRRDGGRGGQDQSTERRGGYSGPRPDATDPATLGEVAAGLVSDRGWERPLAEARVFTAWAEIVGSDVAAHCTPVGLRERELRVAAESTAWATQLRLLGGTVLARVVAELGPDVVTRIVFTGPVAPSWKHGPRSVPGARGPRDTYG